jgi:hypothetical protein
MAASTTPVHADDVPYLRWICVIGLAHAASMGFALLPQHSQARVEGSTTPRAHAAAEAAI